MEAFPPPQAEQCAVCEEREGEILHSTALSRVVWGAGTFGDATRVGHLMVCPRRHVAGIGELSREESVDLMRLCALAARATYAAWLAASSWPVHLVQGQKASYNLGFNSGPQGHDFIPGAQGLGHLHVHVVPRGPNDTNFMWWTTQSSIFHLRDLGMKERTKEELRRRLHTSAGNKSLRSTDASDSSPSLLDGSKAAQERVQDSNEPDFSFSEPTEAQCPLCRETGDLLVGSFMRVLFSVKPYKVGHVMVIPKRHVATIELFSDEEIAEAAQLVAMAAQLACKGVGTDSYSVGINVGPHSGASIPSHCHIHVVPRTKQDCSLAYWPRAEASAGSLYRPQEVVKLFTEYQPKGGSLTNQQA